MTDDEINKRVAEIEGWQTKPTPEGRLEWIDEDGCNWGLNTPPYATEWEWCGPLMEKYKLTVKWDGQDWLASIDDEHGGFRGIDWANTPQRAICLAVIAAHEGRSD